MLLGANPIVSIARGRSMRRRANTALHDLGSWLKSGDRVRMTATLAARMADASYRYRTVRGLEATGDVLLVRERPWWVPFVSVATLMIAGLALAIPPAPSDASILEGTSIAMRNNDVCELRPDAIHCKLGTVERRWLLGAETVFTAFGDFCGARGHVIECMEHDVRIHLHEAPRQVVGARNMICARGESENVTCFNHRGESLERVSLHAERIASGPDHVCALGDDGVWCWHAHGEPFLVTHHRGHRDLGVASSHVCVRGRDAWCVSFDARDRRPWRMPSELAPGGLVSRGDEVCFMGSELTTLACSRSADVPYLDLRSSNATQLALTAERACVRDAFDQTRCVEIYSAGAWDPFEM